MATPTLLPLPLSLLHHSLFSTHSTSHQAPEDYQVADARRSRYYYFGHSQAPAAASAPLQLGRSSSTSNQLSPNESGEGGDLQGLVLRGEELASLTMSAGKEAVEEHERERGSSSTDSG
ncbi:hypothetical protein BDZ45DRAFT_796658 [Acephala macrosclerotiorum]|nr:hypothetical protein BDZ45DRAFT_796658 [Acephala macrosclerotiorum]